MLTTHALSEPGTRTRETAAESVRENGNKTLTAQVRRMRHLESGGERRVDDSEGAQGGRPTHLEIQVLVVVGGSERDLGCATHVACSKRMSKP